MQIANLSDDELVELGRSSLLMERYSGYVSALLCFLLNLFWFHFALMDHGDWSNRLLDRIIQATAVGVAFVGTAITLLISLESKAIIVRLKKIAYFRIVVQYFAESLFASVALLLVSILLEPLSRRHRAWLCPRSGFLSAFGLCLLQCGPI